MIYHFFAHLVPPAFYPFLSNHNFSKAEITETYREQEKRWSCGNSIFRERLLGSNILGFLFFLDFCVHCSLRVLSKGQSTSWLCIKVSHAKGIYWTYPRHSCRRRRLDYAFKLHLDNITKLSNKSHHKLCIQLICSASQKLDFEPTWGRSSRRNSSISLYSQGFPAQNNAHVVPRWQSNTWWCW